MTTFPTFDWFKGINPVDNLAPVGQSSRMQAGPERYVKTLSHVYIDSPREVVFNRTNYAAFLLWYEQHGHETFTITFPDTNLTETVRLVQQPLRVRQENQDANATKHYFTVSLRFKRAANTAAVL